MKTYFKEMLWHGDKESGSYGACVIAPDDDTAARLIALDMLRSDNEPEDNEAAAEMLEDWGYASLAGYFAAHSVYSAWEDLGGHACPNCTAHAGKVITGSNGFECSSCGYRWISLGFGALREELTDAAAANIADADAIDAILSGTAEG